MTISPAQPEISNTNFKPTEPASSEALFQLLFGKHITYSLSAVARLGVADHMSAAPVAIENLAAATGAHAPSLYRVMRMLAGVGVFNESAGKQFSLTAMGEQLKTDTPGSLRYLAICFGDEWSTRGFENLTHAVCTGEDGVTKAYGKHVFEVLADLPEAANRFQQAMVNVSGMAGEAVLESYAFFGVDRIADIGGGHGGLLASIMRQYPQMQGVLFDLPEVVAGAYDAGQFDGLENRIQVESGSFFERVPGGCDAYLLKHILHDWSDNHCRRILSLIREQLPENGRVVACELIVPDEPGPAPAKVLDIEMLALTVGGRERTVDEFRELFLSAGLRLARVVRTKTAFCVLEARRG